MLVKIHSLDRLLLLRRKGNCALENLDLKLLVLGVGAHNNLTEGLGPRVFHI